MTREEAIIVLKYGMKYRNPKNDTEKDRNEALDMAISALSIPEREEGEREVDEDGNVNCPFCGMSVYDNFCSHCGAKMRG